MPGYLEIIELSGGGVQRVESKTLLCGMSNSNKTGHDLELKATSV